MSGEIVSGIISGIVASVLFTVIMLLIRPRIKVSAGIAAKKGEKTSIYKIKIVNLTHSMLTNVKYSLLYCVDYPDNNTDISEIAPCKTYLSIVDKYSRFDKHAAYAVRISYEIDENKYPLKDNTRFEFSVLADHSVSNTTTCKKKSYKAGDVTEGVFETGKSTNILVPHD